MKRVLLDHCVPRPLGRLLVGCTVATAAEMAWSTLKNGELLEAAQLAGFDILITADQNLRYQQNLSNRTISIIELPTNRLRLVVCYAAELNALIAAHSPGTYQSIKTTPQP